MKKILQKIKAGSIKNRPKVFCVSMQRTGTTSVGQFFKDFGFAWSGWPDDKRNKWSVDWFDGNFDKIFSSEDFAKANAYEDSPWFFPEFYKFLYHKFPNSKFILFKRDPQKWFASMVSHSDNNILGRSRTHSKVYRRELEYFDLMKSEGFDEEHENTIGTDKLMKLTGMQQHYIDIYNMHNQEVEAFFERHSPESIIVCELEDPEKWQKLGAFLGVQVPIGYGSHQNKSKK